MANGALKLFANIRSKLLQVSDRNGGAFVLPNFNKYETIPLEIVLVEPDTAAIGLPQFRRIDISSLSISVAVNDTYDDASPLAYQPTFTKDEDLNMFSAELALNTAALNTYLGSSDTKAAYFEIEIQEGTARRKIYTAAITLQNAVTQVSSTTPTPVDEYLTKAQQVAQFVQKIMPASEQLTFTSPSGAYQRIIGVADDGSPIDQILPV